MEGNTEGEVRPATTDRTAPTTKAGRCNHLFRNITRCNADSEHPIHGDEWWGPANEVHPFEAEAHDASGLLREAVIREAIEAVVARRARQSPAIGELDRLAVAVDKLLEADGPALTLAPQEPRWPDATRENALALAKARTVIREEAWDEFDDEERGFWIEDSQEVLVLLNEPERP